MRTHSLSSVALAGALLAVTSGCAAYAASPVTGVLYSKVSGPVAVTSNATGTKVGTGTCTSILGIVATGDCSITTAAQSAGITRIHHVDHETTSMLGVVATYTIRVHGD